VLPSVAAINATEWDNLITSAGAAVFYRHRLLSGYEATDLGGQSLTRYLTVRDRTGWLTSAVPLYFMDGREIFAILRMPVPAEAASRALVSHFPHCYDTSVPMHPWSPGQLGLVWAEMLAEARRVRAALCGFFNIPAGGVLARELPSLTGVAPMPNGTRWFLDVTEFADLDAFLATMSRATRRTLRLAARRAGAAGAVVTIGRGPGADLDDVVAMCAATAARHGNHYYPPAALRAFLDSLDDRLVTITVRLDGRVLAASVCFHDGPVLHTWAGGAHYPRELNWSPNHVLLHNELRLAFELGVRRLECGRRNDEFKARHRLRRLDLVAHLKKL